MSKFNSLLAKVPEGLYKSAGIENADQVQLEQDFGKLAYTFLRDRASGLIPYLLGFEVVEREDDGSKAVGIFGFKIGKDYYYVPAFFINNQIKGMDLLYSKATNMFVPLRETWIDYIVNRQTIQLGGGAQEDEELLRKQFEQPQMDFLATPPSSNGFKSAGHKLPKELTDADNADKEYGKVKSDEGETESDIAKDKKYKGKSDIAKDAQAIIHDGFNAWNTMQQSLVDSISSDAGFQDAWGGAIARLEKNSEFFAKSAENSQLIDWLYKKGGVKGVNALMTTITENIGFAKAALTFYPGVESLFVTKFASDLAPVKEAAKITVITEKVDYIDGKEKRRLVRDGFTIKDTRDEASKSEVFEVDYDKRFGSPATSGVYNVLLRSGGTAQAWVFMPTGDTKCDHCVVVDTKGKNYFIAEPSAVFVRGDEDTEGPDAYSKAKALSTVEPGKCYVLVNKDGSATKPFEVKSVIAENGTRTKFRVYWKDYPKFNRPTYGHDFETLHSGRCCDPCDCNDRDYLEVAEFDGTKITESGKDGLVIPKNWKVIEIGGEINDTGLSNYEARRAMEDAFQPGTLNDVLEALNKNAFHKLTVGSDDGLEYYVRFNGDFVDGPTMNYKAASIRLVSKYAMSVDDAESMLKEAKDTYKARRMIKLGQMVGVSMPNPPPQGYGQDEFTGATTVAPEVNTVTGSMTGVVPPQNSVQPGFNIGGEAQMDQQASGLAEQAAAAGQKNVFEHAAIGGLSKLYDSASVIDSYVPELTKALDRLGRILFLFYWKNEEFAERYGEEDLAELEDMIRGVFKSFGDLVLKLREKAIDADDAENAVM